MATNSLRLIFCLFFLSTLSAQPFSLNNERDHEIYNLIDNAQNNNKTDGQKAISSIEKALNKRHDTNNKELLIYLYQVAGDVYFSQEIYNESLKYFNEELNLMRKTGSKKTYIPLKGIGNVYNFSKDTIKARKYYELALEEAKKNNTLDSSRYIISNNLAILEQKKGNFEKALMIYNEAKETSLKLKDTAGLIMSYQNIGLVNFELKNFELAFKNSFLAEDLAKKKNSFYDLTKIYYNIGFAYKNLIKDNEQAKRYLLKAFDMGEKHNFMIIKRLCSEELSSIYEFEKDYRLANKYLHIAKELNELKLKKQSKGELTVLEYKYQQKIKEDNLIEKQNKKSMLLWTGIIILLLTAFIFILLYKLQKIKLKKRVIENDLLVNQLEKKNKEITEKNLQVLQTTEILDNTSKRLSEIKETSSSKTQDLINQIIGDLKNGSKRFNYNEFEKIFKETHEDFYKKLVLKYPDLTRNEIRLCAFLKMSLSTKEISAITQQSYNSITIARHRLRKKMNLEENQSLTNFLLSL